MSIWQRLKLWWLKRRARAAILRIRAIADSYNCGHAMLMHISGSYSLACAYADHLLDEIAKIDPNCPKERYGRTNDEVQ